MSINIYFTNFTEEDFLSKTAKIRMKKLIKDSITLDDQSKFEEIKTDLIIRCLKTNPGQDISLSYSLDENDFKLVLLRDVKNIDERITTDMIHAYDKAKITFGMKIPNPNEIINDIDKYVNQIFQYILNLSKKCSTKEKLFGLLDNDYINYVQLVCGFHYKEYIDQFFQKINVMTDNTSDIPELIKSTPPIRVQEKDLNQKTVEALNDSEDENSTIHSDDNTINSDDNIINSDD